MLAELHRRERGGGVHVIGNRDRDGVDALALLVEHLAEVFVARRLFPALEPFGAADPVDVGERDDVLGVAAAEDAHGAAAGADAGDVEFLVGRLEPELL